MASAMLEPGDLARLVVDPERANSRPKARHSAGAVIGTL
jgi:hypothetical protein